MTTYDPAYWAALRANDGDTPARVSEQRFWDMLEVLPPADWTHGKAFECFRVIEAQTADLYTWLVRIGKLDEGAEFWEMIAPRSMTPAGLLSRIETAQRTAS
jgi:hypothetical protein